MRKWLAQLGLKRSTRVHKIFTASMVFSVVSMSCMCSQVHTRTTSPQLFLYLSHCWCSFVEGHKHLDGHGHWLHHMASPHSENRVREDNVLESVGSQ